MEPITPTSSERIFLLPGEMHVTLEEKFIVTLLGSCVSVCIRNKYTGAAAMNHFLQDSAPPHGRVEGIGRFGDVSIRYLVESLLVYDEDIRHYQAKIFGGGAVVEHLRFGNGIGKQNCIVAERILSEYGIHVVERDTGGETGRKIYFNTADFSVEVRSVKKEPCAEDITRVLIVDDSSLVRSILRDVINGAPDMEVCGEARDAFEARDLIVATDPDVISLDIVMPKMNGLELLAKIMRYYPKPVVIVSTLAKDGASVVAQAYRYGAVHVIDKGDLKLYQGLETAKQLYVTSIRSAATRISSNL